MSMLLRATLASCLALAVDALQLTASSDAVLGSSKKAPHLVFFLADDLGWGNVGFSLDDNSTKENMQEIQTPNLDKLALKQGVHLVRHYTSPLCSPSRVSFQSGRFPVHLTTSNAGITGEQVGLPLKVTGIAENLVQAGYKAHVVGKWDVGMARPDQLPRARGFHSSLVYFSKGNDMWDTTDLRGLCSKIIGDNRVADLWDDDAPAYKLAGTKFQEFLFRDRALKVIADHNTSHPLFLFYSSHIAHYPTQVPLHTYKSLPEMEDDEPLHLRHAFGPDEDTDCHPTFRKSYRSSVHVLDGIVGEIVDGLRAKNMWDDTLLVFTADNGASVSSGGSNYPYRGGKHTFFEGGVRVPSFVSGGLVPHSIRGSKSTQAVHMADWYMTFAHLAGAATEDEKATHHGLNPLSGINVWPILTGSQSEMTREIPLHDNVLVSGKWKLFTGATLEDDDVGKDVWTADRIMKLKTPSTDHCEHGCLFDLEADPRETNNLWNKEKDVRAHLQQRLHKAHASFHEEEQQLEGVVSACPGQDNHYCACWFAHNCLGGFFGPFHNVTCQNN